MLISKSAIHRFCKKIEVDGFNELKVKLVQDIAEEGKVDNPIDVNLPFLPDDIQGILAQKLVKLYETSIADTYNSINLVELNKSVNLLHNADIIDIYIPMHTILMLKKIFKIKYVQLEEGFAVLNHFMISIALQQHLKKSCG